MPHISVCVPVSRLDSANATIQSIIKQSFTDWELITVGQGDSDDPHVRKIIDLVGSISRNDPRVKYIHIEKPGACRAKNAAILSAQGDIIAEIDDDAEAALDWLETMVAYFSDHPDVDVVGGSVIKPFKKKRGLAVCPSVEPSEKIYDPATMDRTPEGWNWISCNLGLRRNVFEVIGYYDEYLGPGSVFPAADDTDLMLRIEAAGIKMGSTPRLVVNHTYGYRYGLNQFMKHQYNYSYGNGGLAAKQTLAGDPRGEEWYRYDRKMRLTSWLNPFRPDQFVRGMYGWRIFNAAYQRCMTDYQVEDNLLVPAER